MKKLVALALIGVMSLGIFAGCGNGNEKNAAPAEQTNSNVEENAGEESEESGGQEEVELEVSFWGDKAEIAMKSELLNRYEQEHHGIKIRQTYTDGGTYQAKIQMWFSSGKAPDVLGIANDLIEPYKDLGVLEDLRPYMEADGLLDGSVWEQAAVE